MNRNSFVCKISDDVVKTIRSAIKIIKTVQEAESWVKHINKIILIIRKCIQQQKVNKNKNENLFKLEANLSLLKVYKEKLNHFKKSGSGVRSLKNNLIWKDVNSIFKNRVKTGTIINKPGYKDPQIFFEQAKQIFFKQISKSLKQSLLKVNVILSCDFILPSSGLTEIKTFNTKNYIIDYLTDLNKWYDENVVQNILNDLEEFQERDSGWSLYEILHLKVNINSYLPLTGSGFVDLPKDIKNKKAIINVQNCDKYCFLWAVVSALYPSKSNPALISSYPHFANVLNYKGIDFPMSLKFVSKFEDMNNLNINIYTLEKIEKQKHELVPVMLTTKKYKKTIHLLMLPSEKTNTNFEGTESKEEYEETKYLKNKYTINKNNYHFMYIKSLSGYVIDV